MDTFGWDIVSACSQKKLNQLLSARMKQNPPTVSYADGVGINISATFNPWQITSFGSDKKLTLDLPIKSGTLTNTSKFAPTPSVDLSGVIVEVTVTLAFVDNATGDASSLNFDLKTKASSPTDNRPGTISVKSADVNGLLDKSTATTLAKHIAEALIAHSDQLSYALSTVNLQPGTSWMTPKKKAHMFAEGPKKANGEPGDGYLVVVTAVRDLPAGSQSMNVDPALFDSRYDFFMMIAGDVFLEQFIKPEIAHGFVGDPSAQFSMQGDGIAGTGALVCPTVDHWGTGYTPVLSSLRITIENDVLQTDSAGIFQITGLGSHAYVDFTTTQNSSCHYDQSKKAIAFKVAASPQPVWHKHIPWYEYAAALPLLPILGPVCFAIVAAIIEGVTLAVTAGIAHSVTKKGSTSGLNGLSHVAVEWPGSSTTTVQGCGLSKAFYIRGAIT